MNSENITEDPALSTLEKETTLTTANDEEVVNIGTEQRSMISWLLSHPHFREEDRREVDGSPVFVKGTLPRGCVKFQRSNRNDQTVSGMLSRAGGPDG